jgi:glyoxylase-like metal-dependent hydrolase (beta-lactamase superfamily II)
MPSFRSGLRFERIEVPTPYPVGPANAYLFPDDPVTLFDCGPNTAAAERALLSGLEAAAIRPEQIARVVISHGHPDHYGLAMRIRERSGARILAGAMDVPKMIDDSMVAATGRLMLQAGIPAQQLMDMGDAERRLGPLRVRIPDAEPLHEGDELPFDGYGMRVLHLPGHTAGHVCLFDEASGVLFSGDTLLLNISPNPLMEPDPKDPSVRRRSLVEYLSTLDRLGSMALSAAYPGHGPPIHDPIGLIERMRVHHRERTEELAALLDDRGRSGWELANELFPSLQGIDNFLAVSEVVAHVDLLIADGRAEAFVRDGVTRYRTPAQASSATAWPDRSP